MHKAPALSPSIDAFSTTLTFQQIDTLHATVITTLAIPAKKILTYPLCNIPIMIPPDYNQRRKRQIKPRSLHPHHISLCLVLFLETNADKAKGTASIIMVVSFFVAASFFECATGMSQVAC
jgi:hypothetical protein